MATSTVTMYHPNGVKVSVRKEQKDALTGLGFTTTKPATGDTTSKSSK